MKDWQENIKAVFAELKDFQLATVDFAYERLQKNGRYLVADEVGLGKTKIAKGIIARAMEDYIDQNSESTFRVFYICSNQALAAQNLKDLNIFEDEKFINPDLNRLIYLARSRDSDRNFTLSSLTPTTSFKITSGSGHQNERMLIYTVLAQTVEFEEYRLQRGLKWLLIGSVENWDLWQQRITGYQSYYMDDIVPDIPEKYVSRLRKKGLPKELAGCIEELEVADNPPENLLELVFLYCQRLSHKIKLAVVKEEYKARNKLLIYLRKLLIEVSLENLQADLFILDEFQRFKELVGMARESETSLLAQKVFSISGAKCLMLSATPFKLYTTQFDELQNENHYSDLLKLLGFLFHENKKLIKKFETVRSNYFKQLKSFNLEDKELDKTKTQIESIYNKVMCRTEKIIVAEDKDSLLKSKANADLETWAIDLDNFIHTDRTFQTLINQFQQSVRYSIDYNKSVPYPLSFMEGYKSKKKLSDFVRNNTEESLNLIRDHRNAWLDLSQIQQYKLSDYPNAKLRLLITESISEDELWKLLWLPPSVPYYKGMGAYEDKECLSKVLIFSKWVMVPKMVAGLISYEVERRTIANKKFFPRIRPTYSTMRRTGGNGDQVPGESEKRKPLPILRLQLKNKQAASLRSLTLLYPSKTLSGIVKLHENIQANLHYKELRRSLISNLQKLLQPILEEQQNDAPVDKNWYWAAPILLDRMYNRQYYENWFSQIMGHSISRSLKSEKKENRAAIGHLQEMLKMFADTSSYLPLGSAPFDLEKVLIDIALGSPANCLFKCFETAFQDDVASTEILNASLTLAYDFMLMFDKPEAITAVKINEKAKDQRLKENRDENDIHWNLVLRYCIDGNLQAVLDEYCHMLIAKNRSIAELTKAISSGLNLRTSTVKVEGIKDPGSTDLEPINLRCHYAVSFGNQNLEEKSGRTRAGEIINNFNSPFRPFVLASTSLGQEGLDFHYYCRKIVHWNLPYSPVDLEQREGRINRYKGLVIRQNIAKKYLHQLPLSNKIWDELFKIAERIESEEAKQPQILPYWHTESTDDINIERIVPLLPFSRDAARYQELTTVLALYRLTFGQPRQEELLKAMKNLVEPGEDLTDIYNRFIINLSPIKEN